MSLSKIIFSVEARSHMYNRVEHTSFVSNNLVAFTYVIIFMYLFLCNMIRLHPSKTYFITPFILNLSTKSTSVMVLHFGLEFHLYDRQGSIVCCLGMIFHCRLYAMNLWQIITMLPNINPCWHPWNQISLFSCYEYKLLL